MDKVRSSCPPSISGRFWLPTGQSSASIAKSTAADPFTCTTNIGIAEADGVRRSRLPNGTFANASWTGSSNAAPVSTKHNDPTAAEQARLLAATIKAEEDFQAKPSPRLRQLGAAVRRRLRAEKKLPDRPSFMMLNNGAKGPVEEPSSSQNLARRKTKTLNLCKNTISALTSSIHPRSRSYPNSLLHQNELFSTKQWDPSLLPAGNRDSTAVLGDPNSHHLHNSCEVSSEFGSCTRYFNSALDRGLDFETTSMDFLRKTSLKARLCKKESPRPASFAPPPFPWDLIDNHFEKSNPVVPNWQAVPDIAETANAIRVRATPPDAPTRTLSAEEERLPEWAQLSRSTSYMTGMPELLPNRAQLQHPKAVDAADMAAGAPVRTSTEVTDHEHETTTESAVSPAHLNYQSSKDLDLSSSKSRYVQAPLDKESFHLKALGMHSDVNAFAEAPTHLELPDPAKPYPQQLQMNGEYMKHQRGTSIDMLTFLNESTGKQAIKTKLEEHPALIVSPLKMSRPAEENMNSSAKQEKVTASIRKSLSRMVLLGKKR